ncbi:MAG: helix-turn-helix domain-containing protein [Sphingobium sp.]
MNDKPDKTADPLDLRVGQQLRHFRELRNMSQRELALRLEMTFQQLQKYENGKNRISASKLWRLARELDISVTDLFAESVPTTESRPTRTVEDDTAALLEAWSAVIEPAHRLAVIKMVRSLGS